MGEPGKKDNDLDTKSSEEKIVIKRNQREYVTSYYKAGGGRQNYAAVKMTKTVKLQEGDFIKVKVPEEMKDCEEVLITPSRGDKEWFKPMMRRILNGEVALKNIREQAVTVRWGKVIGEMRSCRRAETSKINKIRKAVGDVMERGTKPLWDINLINKVVNEDNDGFKYDAAALGQGVHPQLLQGDDGGVSEEDGHPHPVGSVGEGREPRDHSGERVTKHVNSQRRQRWHSSSEEPPQSCSHCLQPMPW